MLMTRRAAERRLVAVGLSRRHATQVLQAGLAGPPEITTSALLYDADAVEALVTRAPISTDELLPQGLFVARRTTTGLEDLAPGWGIGLITAAWITARIRRHGFVPLVATVGGFVTVGAEIVAVDTRTGADPSRPDSTLSLRPAAAWVDALIGRRLARGPPAGPGR